MDPDRSSVTVVIPTHDRCDLLAEAVASALGQTGVSCEVLVVDDGSRDGTAAWLHSQDDPRLRHLRLEPAQERTAARNAGLAQVTTSYVLFLDDDDLLAPLALQRLVAGLERHRSAPVAAGTYATFGVYGPHELPREPTIGRLAVTRRMWREILWGWYLLPGMGLWRADYLRAIGGWDESRVFAEDLELSLRIHPRPMALVPHVVLRYRQWGRTVDDETEAEHERINAAVRDAFLARLPPAERRVGQRVIEARPVFQQALASYGAGDYRAARAGLVEGLRAAPSLLGSPVLGPMFVEMLGKSTIALATPLSVRRRVREARHAKRAERLGPKAA